MEEESEINLHRMEYNSSQEIVTKDLFSEHPQNIGFVDVHEEAPSKPTYPPLMSKMDAMQSKRTRLSFSTSDRATKRVIAPYVKVIRKSQKPAKEEKEEESKQFKFYLKKKPSVLMRNLSAFLSDSVDLVSILHETCEVLKNVVKAIGATMYMTDLAAGEIYQSPRNVISDRHKVNWKIEPGKTIAAYVAYAKEYVMVDEVLGDMRFPEAVAYKDETVKSVLCVPVVTPDNDCFAVLEFYRDVTQPKFGREDLQIVIVVTGWMGAAIHQNQQRLALQKQQELNDYLLELIKCYLANTLSIDKLVSEVVSFAKITLAADRGSFLIIDKESDVLQADVYEEGYADEGEGKLFKKNLKIKLDQGYGIPGLVARTGESVNLLNAYDDPRFEKDMDDKSGIITRSLLCVPILSVDGILGVVQVVNKKTSMAFSTADENLLKIFSVYCALALHYFDLKTLHFKTNKSNDCYLELVKYHIAPCRHDMTNFIETPVYENPEGFDEFNWYMTPDLVQFMPHLSLNMFTKIIGEDQIELFPMMEFIMGVRKSYRNNPYHNYDHAFNVCHCMYNLLIRNPTMFSKLENKALIISALCHDLDHRGVTNNFLLLTDHTIYNLYDESYLENHHYLMTMLLLGECKMFKTMPEPCFRSFSREIKALILATDLAAHFKNRTRLIQLYHETGVDVSNELDARLVKDLMMTVSDLSGQCKPFNCSKKITDGLYREFYQQGDIEKSMGMCPLSMMDREKQHLVPEDQVQFLTVVVIPCADLIQLVVPNTEDIVKEAEYVRFSGWIVPSSVKNALTTVLITKTRDTWREIIDLRGIRCWRQNDAIPTDQVHDE